MTPTVLTEDWPEVSAGSETVGALDSKSSVTLPLVAVGVLFTLRRLLDPLGTELGAMLWRGVEESMSERVVRSLADPPGLVHVEDPTVLDTVARAEGALTGTTPGDVAAYLGFFVQSRVTAVAVSGTGPLPNLRLSPLRSTR